MSVLYRKKTGYNEKEVRRPAGGLTHRATQTPRGIFDTENREWNILSGA